MSRRLKTLKVIKSLLFVVLSCILLMALLISVLLFTHSGNQLTLSIAEQLEPRLSIELEQGSFLYSPTFTNISWLDQHTEIAIESVSYRFDWSCLFNQLCLQQLDISNAKVIIATSDVAEDKQTEEPVSPVFELPMEILITAINLNKIHFILNDIEVDLDKLHLQANARQQEINLSSIIDGLSVTLPEKAAPQVTPVPEQPLKKSIPALVTEQNLAKITLPFNLYIAPLKVTDFTLKQGKESLLSVNSLTTELDFLHSQLTVHSLLLDVPETDLQLSGKIDFSGHYPLDMQVKGQLKSIQQLQPSQLLAGQHYDLKSYGDLSQLKTELLLSNKLSMQLTAEVDLSTENLPHSVTLEWQKLRWPLTGKAQYASAKGSLQSQGTSNDYQIKFASDYSLENLPSGQASLTGQGNMQEFNVKQLLLKTLNGTAKLNGLLQWQKAIKWDGQLTMNNLDLAELHSDYTGNFSGLVKQNLQLRRDQENKLSWQFDIPKMDISGQFLARPFALKGTLSGNNKQGISFRKITLNNADNKLVINGLLAKKNDLAIKLNIADLSHALLNSSGNIDGEIKVQGPKEKLTIKSNLQGQGLSYQTNKLGAFQLSSETLLSDKPTLALQLTAQKITVAEQVIDDLQIQVKNSKSTATAKTHQIDLSVQSSRQSAELQLELMQDNTQWLSSLTAGRINLAEQQLTLDNPFAAVIEKEQLLIAPHCWTLSSAEQNNSGNFCVHKLAIGQQGEAELTLDSYLLSNLDSLLPQDFKMTGALSADAQIEWHAAEKPSFDVNIFAEGMQVKAQTAATKSGVVTYPVETFKINLRGSKEKSDLSAEIYSPALIEGKIQGRIFPYQSDPTVNAQVNIELPDFSPLAVFLPQLEKLEGRSRTELTVTGPLQAPMVNGQIMINDSAITAIDLPLQIHHLNTLIAVNNNIATIDGAFYSSEINGAIQQTTITENGEQLANIPGRVSIKGTLAWQDKLQGDIDFFANRMLINDYDTTELQVSPDLHLHISEQIKLSGKILVNEGKIKVKELPEEAVSPSKDVIVVDIERQASSADLPISIDLRIDLGNRLYLEAMGLNTTVQGNLLLRKRKRKNPTLHGELSFTDGSYTALGQQLVLQESTILFQGPLDSPYINIKAIRDPDKTDDEVIAGVRVSGLADQLKVVIFSDPAMAQQEALSYILRGKSLQAESDGIGNAQLASMLINLSADKSARVLNEIGSKLGIEDLALSSAGTGDEQSVGVTGYIAPKIQLSYGVGVFDNFSKFAIRYEMFEQFYIEASSGLEQAIDAYYEFDWD